jgi:pimeloyl-ACP methyl ester carboxylesterase
MRLETFTAVGPDGFTRRGVLTHASSGHPKAALVLLPAGTQPRPGPGRLYFDLAERLANDGITTLRIDALGIGESDGTLDVLPTFELWQRIESGAFVPDAILAMRALAAQLGRHVPIYAGGLCGGGLTALVAAADAPDEVAGVIALNIAVRSTPRPGQAAPAVASEARSQIGGYARKLLSPSAWPRALAGGIHLRAIVHTAAAALRRSNRGGVLNPTFEAGFDRAIASGVRQLHLFGGTDARWHQFHDLVLRPKWCGAVDGAHHRVRIVPEAEHHFMSPAWRQQVAVWIVEWIDDQVRAGAAVELAGLGTSSTRNMADGVERMSSGSETL